MIYRIAIQEAPNSKYSVHENLDYSGMLSYYETYKKAFNLKIYYSNDGSFWQIESIFKEGKMIRFMDVIKKESK